MIGAGAIWIGVVIPAPCFALMLRAVAIVPTNDPNSTIAATITGAM